jgi:hypothetical protein
MQNTTVPSLFFIRPDGYIGLLCQPAQEQPLFDYLQRIFALNHERSSLAMTGPTGDSKISQKI